MSHDIETLMRTGADLPFLPDQPPGWLQRAVLNKFPKAQVWRFGVLPESLCEQLSGVPEDHGDLLGCTVFQFGYEDLEPGVAVAYFVVPPDVPREGMQYATRAMTELVKLWANEFPDDIDRVAEFIRSKKGKTNGTSS